MKGKFISLKLHKVAWLALLVMFYVSGGAQTIYVSPVGDDANDGSVSNPVKSFQKGADLAKSQGANTVEFADGEYLFNQTVVLDASYSGITFKAAFGATPVFTSLIQVTGWTPHSGSIMKANLPAGITHVRYIQDKSENWMERSATDVFSTTEKAGGEDAGCIECNNYTQSTQADMSNIRYPSSFTAPDWTKVAQYDLRANTLPWALDVLPLASVNASQRTIYTAVPALYDLRVDGSGEITPKAWVMNSIEGITSAGEWASIDGVLYLFPSSGTGDIYVPQLTELIRVDAGGDGNTWSGTPVQNIVFDGITFTGGDFRPFESTDVTVQHDWMAVDVPDGLLRLRNASNITVQNCTFSKSGGTGLRIDRYAQNHLITNNTVTYLGRGGINIAGRGPGYGDVSTNNEISYNRVEYVGMEQWASVGILVDNSSNNSIHHNYIANTYFTGMAVIGPRQLMFAAWSEGADAFYVGREFHFREIEPSIVAFMSANGGTTTGSMEAMRFVYTYDNRVEENAFVDVCTGQDMFVNGQFYLSGSQKGTSGVKTNYVNRNYFYDSYAHSYNDYAIYSDSDQEDTEYTGNMILGVENSAGAVEAMPIIVADIMWAEGEFTAAGTIRINAHVTENSTFCSGTECGHTITQNPGSVIETGTVVNGSGGSAQFLSTYEQMYAAICDDNFPQIDNLPGAQTMRNRLNSLITLYGGSVPNCAPAVQYSLTTIATNGSVSPASGSFNENEQVQLTATPNAGYVFSSWSGDASGSTNPLTITMDTDKNITANFTAVPTYTLTTSAVNGSVLPASGTFNENEQVQLTATPDAGYVFSSWGGDASGSTNPLTITMDANKSITANFTAVPTYTLTTTAVNGSVSPAAGTFNENEQVQLTATPDAGYQFDSWSGDVTGTSNPVTVTMDANKNITANFVIQTGCTWSIIDAEDFEADWGIWNDGGTDCRRSINDAAYAIDSYCVRLVDNTSTSVTTTNNLDLSSYSEIKVAFSFYCSSMDNSDEDFWLQVSTNGGTSYTTIESWAQGLDFVNDQRYNQEVNIQGPFTSNTKVRFRCDASGNADYVYLDEIVISGCSNGTPVQYSLTTAAINGSISPSGGTYNSGTTVTLTATPDAGYQFDGWSGDASGTNNPIDIIMNANKSVTANFSVIPSGTWNKIDDADAAVIYSGTQEGWNEPVAYMSTVHGLGNNGIASFTFNGTKARFYATTHNYTGSEADVYIDDIYQQSISFVSGSLTGDVLLYESGTLSNGSHTIEIRRTGGEALIDAFEYYGASTKSATTGTIHSKDEGVQIYPNPTKDVININLIGIEGLVDMVLINSNGAKVYTEQVMVKEGFTKQLNVNSLKSGFYFIQIKTKDSAIVKSLVIQN